MNRIKESLQVAILMRRSAGRCFSADDANLKNFRLQLASPNVAKNQSDKIATNVSSFKQTNRTADGSAAGWFGADVPSMTFRWSKRVFPGPERGGEVCHGWQTHQNPMAKSVENSCKKVLVKNFTIMQVSTRFGRK
jgi:hypothetical protein